MSKAIREKNDHRYWRLKPAAQESELHLGFKNVRQAWMIPKSLWEAWAATSKLTQHNLGNGDVGALKGEPKDLITIIC